MSRVLGVVGRSIRGDESDSIIERVERDGEKVRFHYKAPHWNGVSCSTWMYPNFGSSCFINDLRNERAEFLEAVGQ